MARKVNERPAEPAARVTWEETHQRMTFHCPTALRAALEAEVVLSATRSDRQVA